MNVSQETNRLPQTPTPDGFERRLRVRARLPADNVTTPDAEEASPPPKEPGAS